MINNNLFIGNNVTGNFRPQSELKKDIHEYSVEKIDGSLRLVNGKESIELEPVGELDELIVKSFSDELGDLNESIYRLESTGNLVILILYTYSETQKLLLESQKIRIHLLREAEKQICGEGYSDFQLNSTNEIVPLLRDLFINNRSIFVHIDKKNSNAFQMFGKKYRASVKMERPGIYVIDRFYKSYNKEYSFELTQIFGDIDFVLWNDSIGLQGNGQPLQQVQTNEIFKAWNEYMDFEKELYEDRLNDFGFIKYDSIDVDGDQLIFNVSEKITEEKVRNIEFEFMSAFDLKSGGKKELPSTINEILVEKAANKNASVFVGGCSNDGIFEDKLMFEIPRFGFFNALKTAKGILFVSDHSLQVEQKRRKKVVMKIDSKTNESANIIMKLSSENVVDDQLGTRYDPVNSDVLKKMFGNPNVQLKETYREAMSIALNTPDIALIQGPPGTGKTTLIKGVITRINRMNKNYKILVSSEQHEALFNVVDKLSENKFIPPFVSSKKFDADTEDEDNQHFEKNVREFQRNFSLVCNEILRDVKKRDSKSNLITECVYILQDIRDNNYSKNYISTVIDTLKAKIISLGYYDKMTNEFSELYQCIKAPSSLDDVDNLDFTTRNIIRKIEAQRTTLEAYYDDGARQLKDLQNLLSRNEYNELLLPANEYDILQSGDEKSIENVFNKYIDYVESIKDRFIPREVNEFNGKVLDPVIIVKSISRKLSEASKEKPKDFFEIVETLLYRLNDIDAAGEVVKNYTSVIGSTCAQAERSGDIADLQNDRFDYVIIDEAARANPLDIMIPMMMGTKVILIGDHKQLPHYIESNYVNKFKNEKARYSRFDENLLTKSLFQIIFENLDKAYKEGRIKFKRTIQIDEQHRMNPTIGTFISNEFYDGTIKNGEKTVNNINDYNVFNKKNVAWLNVKMFDGPEIKIDQSIAREPEAIRIISLIKELVSKNPGRNLDIGIISFYKGQVKLIKQKLEENFPKSVLENISCNTVDSYQGKEFDIVILSGVRSNTNSTPEKSLGFIHHSASRINVALSRAKKLLVVVADADTYRKTEHFQHFIDYVKKEGYYGQ